MDTRLRSKFKKYFNNVWLMEIIIVIVVGVACADISIKYFKSSSSRDGTGAIEAVFDRQSFYKNSLKNDAKILNTDIYNRTDSLNKLLYSTEREKDGIRSNIYDNSFYSNDKLPKDIYFIIRNKFTDEIFTNDSFFQGVKKIQGENLYKVIEEKYKGEHIITYSCNNVNI
ncbi:MAG: hypothetical protein RR782_07925, partial [Clostridium sp.]